MMRLRYAHITRDMDERQFRAWAINRIASLFDVMLAILIAVALGAYIIYETDSQRASRIEQTDNNFRLLTCLALSISPPDSAFHKQLLTIYDGTCPRSFTVPSSQGSKTSPSGRTRPSSIPPTGGPTGAKRSSSANRSGNAAPAPQTSAATASSSPVARPTGTRTVTVPAPAPSTVTRTRTRTVAPPPRPTRTPGVLCSPLGLPVNLNC